MVYFSLIQFPICYLSYFTINTYGGESANMKKVEYHKNKNRLKRKKIHHRIVVYVNIHIFVLHSYAKSGIAEFEPFCVSLVEN